MGDDLAERDKSKQKLKSFVMDFVIKKEAQTEALPNLIDFPFFRWAFCLIGLWLFNNAFRQCHYLRNSNTPAYFSLMPFSENCHLSENINSMVAGTCYHVNYSIKTD